MDGVYTVVHKERITDEYDITLLRYKDNVRMYVACEGDRVAMLHAQPELIRAVVSPHLSRPGTPDSVTVTSDESRIAVVTFMQKDDKMTVFVDRDGDGFPAIRQIRSRGVSVIEELEFKVISRRVVGEDPQAVASGAVTEEERRDQPESAD